MSKMRKILCPIVIGLMMLATIAQINAPTSKTVSAREQQLVNIKAMADIETAMSRIFPFYRLDSRLNLGSKDGTIWPFDAQHSLSEPGFSSNATILAKKQDEVDEIGVPFKGWITNEYDSKEGKTRLVLKIYDRSKGGTKLYEGTHEVEVIHGQYFAVIKVPYKIVAKSQTIWLEAASVKEKEVAFEPRTAFATRRPEGAAANISFFVGICYSCGGFFEMTGAIPVPSGNPSEYGSNCLAPLLVRTDYRPYLCKTFNSP